MGHHVRCATFSTRSHNKPKKQPPPKLRKKNTSTEKASNLNEVVKQQVRAGQEVRAFKTLKRHCTFPFHQSTFVVLGSALISKGHFDLLDQAFARMKALKRPHNQFTYSVLANACSKKGDVKGVITIMEKLKRNQISTNNHFHNCLVEAHARSGGANAAENALNDLIASGRKADVPLFCVVANAFAAVGDVQGVRRQLRGILVHGKKPTNGFFWTLWRCYLNNGEFGHLTVVLDEMDGFFLVPSCRQILLAIDAFLNPDRSSQLIHFRQFLLRLLRFKVLSLAENDLTHVRRALQTTNNMDLWPLFKGKSN